MSFVEASPEAPVRFRLLGPLEATDRSGRPVDIGGTKQLTVLAVLLLEANRVVPADRLVELVWGEEPPPSAAATLQAYVSNLRRALEPDRRPRTPSSVIATRSSGYVVLAERSEVDATLFEDVVAEGRLLAGTDPAGARRRLAAALELWRGPALVDFAGEPFAVGVATRLEGLRLTVQEDLGELMLVAGDHLAALPVLEELVAGHPLRERSCGLLVRALYQAGRQAEALAAYGHLRTALRDELGLDPSPELRALEQAVLTHDPSLATPQITEQVPGDGATRGRLSAPAREGGIVGRRSELSRFATALARADTAGSLLLVEGEAGIGKSHLLGEMDVQARAAGALVVTGRCVEGGGAPAYWPWIQVARQLASVVGPDQVMAAAGPWSRLIRPLLPDLEPAADDALPNALLIGEALAAVLTAIGVQQPVVVLLDDLYGSDPDSLAVLGALTDGLPGMRVVVVGTYRTSDVPDEHPLTALLARVTRSDRVERLPLARFQPDAVGRLVEGITGEPVDDATAQAIHRQTGGNALFTVELARLLRAEGDLHDPQAVGVPPGVRDVIRRRLALFDDPVRTLLSTAAVAGRDFDVGLVASAAGLDVDTSIDAVESALSAQLLEETDDPGRFRFSHVLVQVALAEQSSALRRAHLHQQFAAAMEDRHGQDPAHWPAIAHHAVEAVSVTGPEPAIAPLRRAASHAGSVGAVGLAVQLGAQVIDLVAAVPAGPDRDHLELEVQHEHLWALTMEGFQHPQLAAAASRVIELARATGRSDAVLHGQMSRMGHAFVTGRFADADDVASEIGRHAESEDSDVGRVCHHLGAAIAAFYQGRLDDSSRHFDACQALVQILDPGETGTVMFPPGQQSMASVVRGFRAQTLWLLGRGPEAAAELRRSVEVADVDVSGFSRSFALMLQANVAYMDGDPVAAQRVAEAARRDPNGLGFPENTAIITAVATWGRARLGTASIDEVLAACGGTAEQAVVQALQMWGAVADAGLHLGQPQVVLDAADRALESAQATGARMWLPEVLRLRAAALDLLGDQHEADAALAEAADLAAQMGAVALSARIDAWSRERMAVTDR